MLLSFRLSFRRLRRVPLIWWLIASSIAVVSGFVVAQSVAQAQEAAARYEGLVNVFVASHPLSPGTRASANDVRQVSWPRLFLPKSTGVANPVGSVATSAIAEGEPLMEINVGASGLSDTAAMLRPGEQGVAVPRDETTPPLQVGDYVDVLGSFESEETDDPMVVVSAGARVVDTDETVTTVAVLADDAPKVAFAVTKGSVAVVITVLTGF